MRLFIAMPLPKNIEESLGKVIFVLKQKRTRVSWVAPKNIHLTLKFLGETDEQKVKPISEAIAGVAAKYGVINSGIDQIGAFPNLNRPRIIWAGLSEETETLAAIAFDMENEMEKLGFAREARAFKSHLTLGRVKDSFNLGELAEAVKKYEFAPEKALLDSIVLFKSTLTAQGAIYERLFQAPLKS